MANLPPQRGKARVIVVDDHPVVRRGLAQLINHETDLEVCKETGSAQETLKAISEQEPDIVVLDLTLGDTNGFSLIKDIKMRHKGVAVLVLSMHDESLYAERALRAGAQGYIMKEEATERVIGAIRRVLKGDIHLSEKMSTRLLSQMLGGTKDHQSHLSCLSDRELEVFELIGRGLQTRQIAEKLHLSVKIIETHRANIKRKLDLGNAIELLQYATQWAQDSTNDRSQTD
ncbi:MAG: response regulator transcription factor [Candidatus Pacebacteria bacterium]|nr:response regulator transcription factor [Candidatus Paceibacterota bacterium]